MHDMKTSLYYYNEQKARSARRNIDFLLTFDEWLDIWVSSGKYHLRGRGIGKYCMGRRGDTGPYAVGNVDIISFVKNASDANIGGNVTSFKPGHHIPDEQRKNISAAVKQRWEEYRREGINKYAGWKKPEEECPHCKRIVRGKRWHFDNCRERTA